MELSELFINGFDLSELDPSGYIDVACSSCEALVINGHACHEHGCPNIREVTECPECGIEYDEREQAELCCSGEGEDD